MQINIASLRSTTQYLAVSSPCSSERFQKIQPASRSWKSKGQDESSSPSVGHEHITLVDLWRFILTPECDDHAHASQSASIGAWGFMSSDGHGQMPIQHKVTSNFAW